MGISPSRGPRNIDVPPRLENVYRRAGEPGGLQINGHPELNPNVFTTAVKTGFGIEVKELLEEIKLKRLAIKPVGKNSVITPIGDGEQIVSAIRDLDGFHRS